MASALRPAERPTIPICRHARLPDLRPGVRRSDKVRKAIAAYFGLVSFVDHNVGRLIEGARGQRPRRRNARHLHQRPRRQPRHARAVGQVEHVRGVGRGADDHGRARGAARRRLPRAGLAGRCFPTIVDCVGQPKQPGDWTCPVRPCSTSCGGRAAPRTVMSEYHAAGAATGAFMIRKGSSSTCTTSACRRSCSTSMPIPRRRRDLGQNAGYRGVVADCEAALRKVVDPEAADARPLRIRRPPRDARRPRGDPGARQLRVFAGSRHQAGLRRNGKSGQNLNEVGFRSALEFDGAHSAFTPICLISFDHLVSSRSMAAA